MFKVSAISDFSSYLSMKIKSVKEDSANWLDLNLNFCIFVLGELNFIFVRAGRFVL